MSDDSEKYVTVTAIAQYRMRYCVPMSKLQEFNEQQKVDPLWAEDCVTMNEIEEFSQLYLGEIIIDSTVVDQDTLLQMFDKENDYLSSWTTEQKLEMVQRAVDSALAKKDAN